MSHIRQLQNVSSIDICNRYNLCLGSDTYTCFLTNNFADAFKNAYIHITLMNAFVESCFYGPRSSSTIPVAAEVGGLQSYPEEELVLESAENGRSPGRDFSVSVVVMG